MAERAEPAQDGRHKTAHQRAVAVGQRFQRGMRAGAVELVVERALPVQHAVDNVGRDSPCREAGYVRAGEGALRGHGAEMFSRNVLMGSGGA